MDRPIKYMSMKDISTKYISIKEVHCIKDMSIKKYSQYTTLLLTNEFVHSSD